MLIAAPTASADGFREAEVRKALTAAGFGDIAGKVAAAARPAVTIDLAQRSREPAVLGRSRLGGRPDLPEGTAWPLCKGKPQTFLAQFRLRELPKAARELRRLGGTLLFFTHVEFEPGEREYGLWAGDCTTVVHARAGAKLRRTAVPSGTLSLRPSKPRFSAQPDVPDFALDEDFLMAPLRDVTIRDWESWFDVRNVLLRQTAARAPAPRLQQRAQRRRRLLRARRARAGHVAPPVHHRPGRRTSGSASPTPAGCRS